MVENPLIDYDWSFADFAGRLKTLETQGLRLRSLSMYGSPANPLFAAVWRTGSTPWRWYLGYTRSDFASAASSCAADGLFPTLVAVTGGGTAARYSGTFEPLPNPTELTLNQSLQQFDAEVGVRADGGWLPRSIAIHDSPTGPTSVTAVWERNTANVAWNAFAGHTLAEQQTLFDVMYSGWARPVIMGASTQNKHVAVFRDDQVAGIGQGFAARGNLTIATFLKEQKAFLAEGMWTASVQGYGPPGAHRYTAIFVVNDKPVARTQRVTGSPAVPAIDDPVMSLMKQSNIRGASLAIVHDARLVLARAYTWAEPDYPTVQPTTLFRLASGSKLLAAIALHQLLAEGTVSAQDPLPQALPLDPPPGKTLSPLFSQSTVGDLLDNQCQLNPDYEERDAEIEGLFGSKPPATLDHIARWICANTIPAAKTGPNDGGFYLAGELVRRFRGQTTLTKAIETGISTPLHITRLRGSRTLMTHQPADEARHHPRWLTPVKSVMSADQPTVLGGVWRVQHRDDDRLRWPLGGCTRPGSGPGRDELEAVHPAGAHHGGLAAGVRFRGQRRPRLRPTDSNRPGQGPVPRMEGRTPERRPEWHLPPERPDMLRHPLEQQPHRDRAAQPGPDTRLAVVWPLPCGGRRCRRTLLAGR